MKNANLKTGSFFGEKDVFQTLRNKFAAWPLTDICPLIMYRFQTLHTATCLTGRCMLTANLPSLRYRFPSRHTDCYMFFFYRRENGSQQTPQNSYRPTTEMQIPDQFHRLLSFHYCDTGSQQPLIMPFVHQWNWGSQPAPRLSSPHTLTVSNRFTDVQVHTLVFILYYITHGFPGTYRHSFPISWPSFTTLVTLSRRFPIQLCFLFTISTVSSPNTEHSSHPHREVLKQTSNQTKPMLLLLFWHFSHNKVQCHWNYISTYIHSCVKVCNHKTYREQPWKYQSSTTNQ